MHPRMLHYKYPLTHPYSPPLPHTLTPLTPSHLPSYPPYVFLPSHAPSHTLSYRLIKLLTHPLTLTYLFNLSHTL